MSKVEPAEIYASQQQKQSGPTYPQLPVNSATVHFSQLQFAESFSSSGNSRKFVPVVGLVDNLAPTAKISDSNRQESGDQANQSAKKLSYFKVKMDQLGTQVKDIPNRMGSWSQFFDFKQFSFPNSGADIVERFRGNLSAFYANYAIIGLILLAYCLLTSPLLLIGVAIFGLLAYSIITRNQDLSLLGLSLTRNQQLLGLSICFIPLFVFLGLSGVFFWLIGATTFVIALHSLFHNAPQSVDPSGGGNQSGLSGDVNPEPTQNGFQVITL